MKTTPISLTVFAVLATATAASAQTMDWERPNFRGYHQDYYDSHPGQRGYHGGTAWGMTEPGWSYDPYGSAAIRSRDRFIDPYNDR